jgi:hypothetical protein
MRFAKWELDMECSSFVNFALHRNRATVQSDEFLHHRQPFHVQKVLHQEHNRERRIAEQTP